MSKKSNRGFTLIELIIAMSIFTIVISGGYQIINRINNYMKKNEVIHENQISVNLVNKYVTKDLEKSVDFHENYSDENKYSFLIKVDDYKENNYDIKFIKYEVNLVNEKANYDVIRTTYKDIPSEENQISKISLIENQKITVEEDVIEQRPFVIERQMDGLDSEGNTVYKDTYSVRFDSGKSKKYSFDVTVRISVSSFYDNTPTILIVQEDENNRYARMNSIKNDKFTIVEC